METNIIKCLLFLLVFSIGCGVSRYSANTTARYKVCDATGVCTEFYYDSETEKKIVLELVKEGDQVRVLKFSIETGTSEAALAAALSSNSKLADVLEKLAPFLAKAAMAGSMNISQEGKEFLTAARGRNVP